MLERVMIISGESSGELYGALLARALKSRNPEMRIVGVGGDRMESAGVEFISRISSSFGLTEAVKTYGEIRKTFRKVVSAFKSFSPQVVVLIDYPDFNIRVAREAKRLGIRVLYYVSPQVWAWRMKRVKTIAELVDMMAVILPFEVDIYRQTDVRCEFVGHPVMDEITEVVQDSGFGIADIGSAGLKSRGKNELGLLPDKPVMALMPGSRLHEVEKLLPVMADVATEMKRRYPDYQFVMPLAPNLDEALFPRYISEIFHVVKGRSIKALLSSDIALIASGTSTLQAALLGIPTVVIYKLSPLTYFIGKLIVKVKHISLVNILLDKSVEDDSGLRIRELLQADANKENIMSELVKISDDLGYRNEMLSQLTRVRSLFLDKKASLTVADMIEHLGETGGVKCSSG